ncbi:hypothetical protein WJX79_006467 [Trebouxia sp. C0005]
MVVDQVWDDDTFEEPLEARKQRKPLTSHAAVVKSAAPAQVLDLPADICDTVELQYRPPGHISAGLTCQITIMFTPKLPATAIQDICTASVILRNTTPDPQTFEFIVPQGSDMTLSPHVDTIQGGGSLRVMLRYCPQPSTAPAVPAESDLLSATAPDATPEGTAGSTGAGAANAADTDEIMTGNWFPAVDASEQEQQSVEHIERAVSSELEDLLSGIFMGNRERLRGGGGKGKWVYLE